MERLNALLGDRLAALHADCVAARPDADGDAASACRVALNAVYWGIVVLIAAGDALIVAGALYFGVGVWSAWGAVALGCLSALAFYALTAGVRRRIDAL